jgi:hypothetical protein
MGCEDGSEPTAVRNEQGNWLTYAEVLKGRLIINQSV